MAAEMSFFDIELGKLDRRAFDAQVRKSKFLSHNRPYLEKARKWAKYNLSESAERLLAKISPFGAAEWDDMMDEMETKLAFPMGAKKLGLSEILHVMNNSRKGAERLRAMKVLNGVLASSNYAGLRARALNLAIGEKNAVQKERGFKTAMESRNLENNLDAGTVKALHDAVLKYGAPQGKRYYNILGKLLGKKVLSWADRNAPLPFEDRRYIPYRECVDMVSAAYGKFSPRMEEIIRGIVRDSRIDAPVYAGKTSGAYNSTIVTQGGKVQTYTFLNYLGTSRDVMTLAHELGHAVHGILAGEAQGVLQADAPMAYAETASIFGEMLAFEHLIGNTRGRKARLALLMSKAGDWLNSVNRQISFSFFEQRVHEERKRGKLTCADFSRAWLGATKQMYGRDGEAFEYGDMENLWSYVGHFMRPFYVYAYAFGELFTQSLFAAKDSTGNFEKLYLDMLASGGTKDAAALMRPFGLDPSDPGFWRRGIDVSIKKWLDEAEELLEPA
jgi:oligoendopeptidase F